MTRALIYCRISSDPTGRAAGVQRQEKECRQLAQDLDWEILDVLVDNDISAYSGKRRPAYEQMLTEIREDRADAIVAWHTDRLYRRSRDLTELIDIANDHKVQIRTVNSGHIDLSTASGRMMARVVAAVSEHEVEHGQERMRLARDSAAVEGRWMGGGRPFGYEPDGVTIRPDEATEVATAIRRVLMGGTISGIAADWNARSLHSARGKEWVPTTVRRLLMRARNAGLLEHRGQIVGQAQWPALVPEHEWQAVRRLLADPQRQTSFTRDRKYLGSGLYLCGLCTDGSRVHAHAGGSGGRPRYRCLKPGRHQLIRSMAPVDAYVRQVVSGLLRKLAESGQLRLATPGDEEVSGLYAEAASIQADLEGLRRALEARQIDLAAYTATAAQWKTELDGVQEQIQARVARSPLMAVLAEPDPAGAWLSPDLPLDIRRAVADSLVTITLLPAKQGRLPGGRYFDPVTVVIKPRPSPVGPASGAL